MYTTGHYRGLYTTCIQLAYNPPVPAKGANCIQFVYNLYTICIQLYTIRRKYVLLARFGAYIQSGQTSCHSEIVYNLCTDCIQLYTICIQIVYNSTLKNVARTRFSSSRLPPRSQANTSKSLPFPFISIHSLQFASNCIQVVYNPPFLPEPADCIQFVYNLYTILYNSLLPLHYPMSSCIQFVYNLYTNCIQFVYNPIQTSWPHRGGR